MIRAHVLVCGGTGCTSSGSKAVQDAFIENINALFGSSYLLKHILLPLGISFFTFQQISFLQLVCSGSLKR